MLVYHFLDARYGLKGIRERRLKISEVSKLNDPFEFLAAETVDEARRRKLVEFKDGFFQGKGLICFSRNWRNPVQWSHYADRHRGLCLGFDIRPDLLMQVSYVASRFPWPEIPEPWPDAVGKQFITQLLTTKFAHWSYEDEFRFFMSRTTIEPDGLAYIDFSEHIKLSEVLIGARCDLAEADVSAALGEHSASVAIHKVREAFRSFEVVRVGEDERIY